jgi:hypothetical protein
MKRKRRGQTTCNASGFSQTLMGSISEAQSVKLTGVFTVSVRMESIFDTHTFTVVFMHQVSCNKRYMASLSRR